MEREFNLVEQKWICVMTDDCKTEIISLHELFLNAHKYAGLSGETKTQDFAVLRFLLAVIYTVFSRYDADGNEIDTTDDPDCLIDNWEKVFKSGTFPIKPFEKYFSVWYDRFWLFDDEYPFYQSNAVKGKCKMNSTAKMIGSLFESGNKPRLFTDRNDKGRLLSYPEAARWLLHIICFDDIAAKNPTPKRTWAGKLSLIATKGKNLFETLMLNYNAECDSENDVYISKPSWEQDNESPEFNRIITVPDNQAELLSLLSRRICLNRENGNVNGYYLAGGDYFEDDEVFNEQMTLWRGYSEDKNSTKLKFKPRLHDPSTKAWQEFGSIAVLNENAENGYRTPGIIKWTNFLIKKKIISRDYLINISTAAVIYNYKQATSLPVIDVISDALSFHSQLLLDAGTAWRTKINYEIGCCAKTAKEISKLSINLQKAAGADGDKLSGDDAKAQFYSMIDLPFRIWLEELDTESDIDEYSQKIETEIKQISLSYGQELVSQLNASAIFGRSSKTLTSVSAFNIFNSAINKIFSKEGDNNE